MHSILNDHTRHLVDAATRHAPLPLAVVKPETTDILQSVREAEQLGIVTPLLIGDGEKIFSLAHKIDWTVSPDAVIDALTPSEALKSSIQCLQKGRARALKKGGLPTDTFMQTVLDKKAGVRGSRRMSHVFLMDIPSLKRPLIITDGALNIAPDNEVLVEITRNAIDVAHMLGNNRPKVAVLSAREGTSSTMPTSIQAELVAKECIDEAADVVGPLSLDLAVSAESARLKGYESAVAGGADVLVVPNIETGNSLVKALVYFANATAAGVVVGGTIPLVLTSRSDSIDSRVASMALASILSSRGRNSRTASA